MGLKVKHFNQWASDDVVGRFRVKVSVCPETGCHLWIGVKSRNGYGWIRYQGKRTRAHRVSMILQGYDVSGKHVLHRCNNRACVNPDHLYLGDHNDNMRDMALSGIKQGEKHPLCRVPDTGVSWVFEQKHIYRRNLRDISIELGISEKTVSEWLCARKRKHITTELKRRYSA